MGKIFICYRRDDSQHQAGRLYDRLLAKFGEGNVFWDVDAIPFAVKFPERIQTAIAECDVLLALIGESWLDARDKNGNRRLGDANDYVRLEIEEALRQGVMAVPVLLDGASMPSKEKLPLACRELADVNAPRVRAGSDFKHDIGQLLDTIAAVIAARERQRAEVQARLDIERKAQEEAELERERHAQEQADRKRRLTQRHPERKSTAAEARQSAGPRPKVRNKVLLVALASVAVTLSLYAAWANLGPRLVPAERVTESHQPDGTTHAPNPPQPGAPAPVPAKRDAKTITNSIGMTLALIPAGEFMMGSPASEPGRSENESPQHRVTISQPFYLGTTAVTQSQWEAVMQTPSWHGHEYVKEGPDYPATYVSWREAAAFCQELSRREGQTYRLPTEAEWEYACRAGTTTSYSFSDDPSKLGDYAWYDANAGKVGEDYAHRVGQKRANPFGLYDMHGNVVEWCSDWLADDYYAKSPPADPFGPSSGSAHVLRGGYWQSSPVNCRSAHRLALLAGLPLFNSAPGFRVLRVR